jgi:type II secretory pathway pseudopilin PulG
MPTRIATSIEVEGREAGFTLVEVIVAALILVLGATASFGLLRTATKNAQRAKATQVAQNQAQQELEKLRSLDNEELAMTVAPAHAGSELDPNYRVNGGTFALIRKPPSDYATMVVNGGSLYGGGFVKGGVITPGPLAFSSGDVTGKVYRYVVWRNDETCPDETCPGAQDYKQIVVAVKLDTPGNQSGERGYVEVASDFIDPEDSVLNDPIPGAGGVVTAQQFYLSDTPCAKSGATARQDILGDHLLHNTLGTCESGLQSGPLAVGAPDALLLGSPPDPAPENDLDPPLFDYSDDSYLEPTPDTDKGIQVRRDDTNGCHFTPSGKTNPESQVHRWVTDKMASDFVITDSETSEGNVTIELFSRSLNGTLHKGTVCVFLFKRSEAGSPPVATDTLLVNKSGGLAYWELKAKENGFWPTGWEAMKLPMSLSKVPYTISSGHRLGLALSVERNNTSPAEAIPIMYDHPFHATRIEVDTSTPIDGG